MRGAFWNWARRSATRRCRSPRARRTRPSTPSSAIRSMCSSRATTSPPPPWITASPCMRAISPRAADARSGLRRRLLRRRHAGAVAAQDAARTAAHRRHADHRQSQLMAAPPTRCARRCSTANPGAARWSTRTARRRSASSFSRLPYRAGAHSHDHASDPAAAVRRGDPHLSAVVLASRHCARGISARRVRARETSRCASRTGRSTRCRSPILFQSVRTAGPVLRPDHSRICHAPRRRSCSSCWPGSS